MKKYYALAREGNSAEITIYGDITSWPWLESDVSAYLLSKRIEALEADVIDVYINSYGGEVAEGLAIYSALKRHRAKVHTHCDGFACSAASLVFMAGEERTMGEASLLMIHNAWSCAQGNARELRKAADDLEIISATAANAYRGAVSITGEALTGLLDQETWITPQDAVTMGFATGIETYGESRVPAASARGAVMKALTEPAAMNAAHTPVDSEKIAQAVVDGVRELLREKPEGHPRGGDGASAVQVSAQADLGAGAIHLPRACEINHGVPARGEAPCGENKTLKFIEALTRQGGMT